MKIYLVIIGLLLSILGCEKEDDQIESWWINSAKKDCVGVGPMSCLQIQKGETLEPGGWQFFYDQIQGFEYEAGYIYQVLVKVSDRAEPIPADASSKKYELVKVLSKEVDPSLRITNIWKVIQVGEIENPTNPNSSEPLLFEIKASERSYSGSLGCNSISGTILDLDAAILTFGPGAVTEMACADMTVENAILQAITATKSYQIAENQLTLLDEKGAELMLLQAVD